MISISIYIYHNHIYIYILSHIFVWGSNPESLGFFKVLGSAVGHPIVLRKSEHHFDQDCGGWRVSCVGASRAGRAWENDNIAIAIVLVGDGLHCLFL